MPAARAERYLERQRGQPHDRWGTRVFYAVQYPGLSALGHTAPVTPLFWVPQVICPNTAEENRQVTGTTADLPAAAVVYSGA
jgi:hypothetical protein